MSTPMETNGNPPRARIAQATRQVTVKELMLEGYTPLEIASVKIDGRKIGNYKTILNDTKYIKSEWLKNDPEWFQRARIVRIEAEERISKVIRSLNNYLHGDDLEMSLMPKEKLFCTQILLDAIIANYNISMMQDPEEYLRTKVAERAELVAEMKREAETSGQDTSKQFVRTEK